MKARKPTKARAVAVTAAGTPVPANTAVGLQFPKPTVGRIVNFFAPECEEKGQPYPAMITHVFENNPDIVNLVVFGDLSYPLKLHGSQYQRAIPRGLFAPGKYTWDWPQRV